MVKGIVEHSVLQDMAVKLSQCGSTNARRRMRKKRESNMSVVKGEVGNVGIATTKRKGKHTISLYMGWDW